jgi:hypothetical protein
VIISRYITYVHEAIRYIKPRYPRMARFFVNGARIARMAREARLARQARKQPRENIVRGKQGGFTTWCSGHSGLPYRREYAVQLAVENGNVSNPTRRRTRSMTLPDTISLRTREVPKSKRKINLE